MSHILELVSREFEEHSRSVGGKCQYDNNENCFFTNETTYDSTCCSSDKPCGILQGGCVSDSDCFHNLECVADTCGLSINETRCCQAPGRKPSNFA